ncbi:hypothetical protein PFISCL1PPCAC_15467, partial [Pristionchus fissidentatus]
SAFPLSRMVGSTHIQHLSSPFLLAPLQRCRVIHVLLVVSSAQQLLILLQSSLLASFAVFSARPSFRWSSRSDPYFIHVVHKMRVLFPQLLKDSPVLLTIFKMFFLRFVFGCTRCLH